MPRVGIVGVADAGTEVGREVVGDLVARPELKPQRVLQTLQLAIEAVLIDARQGGEHRGELLAHCRGDELR